jgi:hypothetical protein
MQELWDWVYLDGMFFEGGGTGSSSLHFSLPLDKAVQTIIQCVVLITSSPISKITKLS